MKTQKTVIPQFILDRVAVTKMTTEERTTYMKLTRRIFASPSTKAVDATVVKSPINSDDTALDTKEK